VARPYEASLAGAQSAASGGGDLPPLQLIGVVDASVTPNGIIDSAGLFVYPNTLSMSCNQPKGNLTSVGFSSRTLDISGSGPEAAGG
jgi:hypothetical protein